MLILGCTDTHQAEQSILPILPEISASLSFKLKRATIVQSSGQADFIRLPEGYEFRFDSSLRGTRMVIPFNAAEVTRMRLVANYQYQPGSGATLGTFSSAEGGNRAGSGFITSAALAIGNSNSGFELTGELVDQTVSPVETLSLAGSGAIAMSCVDAEGQSIPKEYWSTTLHCQNLAAFLP